MEAPKQALPSPVYDEILKSDRIFGRVRLVSRPAGGPFIQKLLSSAVYPSWALWVLIFSLGRDMNF